jgi:catechol-2,3-dioxygenase
VVLKKFNIQQEDFSMKPRITVITLGVNDLEKAVEFYRDGLGFPTE